MYADDEIYPENEHMVAVAVAAAAAVVVRAAVRWE
jgi:hypothetical protein